MENFQELSRAEMKHVLGGDDDQFEHAVSCGSCNSHPGLTCSAQDNGGYSECFCGPKSNYIYC